MNFFEWLFLLLWGLLALPVLILAIQVCCALFYRVSAKASLDGKTRYLFRARTTPKSIEEMGRPRLALLVPAHNEEAGIAATLRSIQAQMQSGDRILVVADNCTDSTADIARALGIEGAEVIERQNKELRGKSYALAYGVQHLVQTTTESPLDVVVTIDADCQLQPNALDILIQRCQQRQRPIQALYLMHAPMNHGLKTRIAEFAWIVKNRVRPLGYACLGLPCQLMGTGMAFPWSLLQKLNLANGHIVEDLKLGLECAERRAAPLFCPEALVTSTFPANSVGEAAQRTRWEHGHLSVLLRDAPRLLIKSFLTLNLPLLVLALDLCIPPLALLTMLVMLFAWLGLALLWLANGLLPWGLALLTPIVLGAAIWIAWHRFGRSTLPFSRLLYAPVYAVAKLPLYARFLLRRQVEWVRSERDSQP